MLGKSFFIKICIFLLPFLFVGSVFAQVPANDECTGATALGSLPTPALCPSGLGAIVTRNGQSNTTATSGATYVYQTNCPVLGTNLPKDVWYSFVATGYQAVINVNGATFANPIISLWQGTCANLGGRGCVNGTGGAATLTVNQLTIGATYYVQVSGLDSTQVGTFNLTARNNVDCQGCVLQASLTANPLPINNMYAPNTLVTFCFSVINYTQTNTNWMHGVQPSFGSGWDISTLVPGTPPASCDGDGVWSWYPSGITASNNGSAWPRGFYYDRADFLGTVDGDPGNNFGDDCTNHTWTFCVSVRTIATCNPYSDLSATFNTSGDGESGSWSNLGCTSDVPAISYNIGRCCPPILTPTPTTCGKSNGSVVAAPLGNRSPWDYSWSNSVSQISLTTNGSISNVSSGTYTVTVTDGVNCTASASTSVNSSVPANAGVDRDICLNTSTTFAGSGSGSWIALPGNPSTVSINNPSSNTSSVGPFTILGTYSFQWTSGVCIDTMQVVVIAKPNAGIDKSVSCFSTDSVAMTAAGTGTWSPLASNPGTATIRNLTSPTSMFGPFTAAGTYNFVWTNNGCTDTVSIVVGSACGCSNPPTINLPVKLATICYNQTQTISVNFGGSATNVSALSSGTGLFNSLSSSVSPFNFIYTPSAFDIAAGSVRLIFNTNNPLGSPCVIATDTFVLSITAKPNAGPDQTICQFTSTAFSAVGTGTWTALSTNPAVVTITTATSNTSSVGAFTTAGNYDFVWTSNGCTDTVRIEVTPKPNAGADQTICQFTSTALSAVGTGNWTALSTNPALVALANASTPNSGVGAFSVAGNYSFVWISNGCTDTVNIEARPEPAVVINNQNICIGQSYVTARGNVLTSSGIYYDTLPSLSNCDSVIQTNLNFYGTLIQASSDVGICLGDSTQLTATGGTIYRWSPAAGLNDTSLQSPIASPLATTRYIVSSSSFGPNQLSNSDFESGNTGFSSAYTYATDITPEGTYYITPNPQIPHSGFLPCPDHTTGSGNMMVVNGSGTPGTSVWQQTISVNPGTDYAFGCWGQSVVGGSPAILQFEINGVVLGAPFALNTSTCLWEQFYTLWNSGASSTATITILNQNTTVGGNDFALDDILFAPVCYGFDTVTVTVHNPSNTIIDTSICQGQSYTMPDGSQVNTTGPYQYVAQTIWGCDSIIDINLTVKPQPVITASNDTLLNCTATTVILSATSSVTNTNFTWTGGATGSSLNVNTPNTYTVTGNADGCISSAVVIVTIDTLKPNVNAGVDRILTCSDTLFELLATSTTSNVSFAWSNTASTPNTTITSPNTYTVTATDTTNGCSSTDAAVVSQNITPPSVSLGPNRSLTCSVLSINLVPQTNAIISDYEWSTSVQTPTINVNSPNVYSVTVISAINGCSGSASITIDEASRPQAFFNAGDNPCIDVSKGFIETNIVGGVAPFTFNWSNGSILSSIYGIKGGVYTIYIRDSNGCVVDTVISIVNGEFLIDAYESTTINLGDEAQILTQIAGGSGSYDLVWSPKRYLDCYTCDNVTSGALQNITYTVLATDTNGCRATDTVTITVNPEYPLYVPNAFTPNNDGFNDFFEIFGNKKIWLTMTIRIFNRWGELVFETSDQKFRWDGRYKGELLTPQVLTYVLDVDYVNGVKEKAVKGSLTLIK